MSRFTDSNSSTIDIFILVIVVEIIQPQTPDLRCTDSNGNIIEVDTENTFSAGLTNVICVATDMVGNSVDCPFQLEVIDDDPPFIECPVNIIQGTMEGVNSSSVTLPINVTDNVDPMPTMMCNYQSGATFYYGNTTVRCNFSDASNNSANCTFDVIIEDREMPVPVCPESGLTFPTSTGSNSTIVPLPVVTDNVDPNPTTNCAFPDDNMFQFGRHNVACTFQDASGNTATCAYTIIVVDREPPMPSCPASLSIHQIPGGQSSVVVTYSVSATDNVDSSPDIACSPAPGSEFSVGESIIECVFTDQDGNNNTCSFNVLVEDTEPPTVSCPANITLPTSPGGNSEMVTFSATASDLVDPSATASCQPASASRFTVGDTLVTCTASDESMNVATRNCSFTIRIEDRERPNLLCVTPDVTADIGSVSAVVTLDVTAEDNVDASPTISCSPPSGEVLEVNIPTDYTCTATDTAMNIVSCDLEVIVQEAVIGCLLPRESWLGQCLDSRRLTVSVGIEQINGEQAFASFEFILMAGPEYHAFRRKLIDAIANIVNIPRALLRIAFTQIQRGSINVDMTMDIFGNSNDEVTRRAETVVNSSFTALRSVNELSSGGDVFTFSFFSAKVPVACDEYCLNGGTCLVTGKEIQICSCLEGTTGETCENVMQQQPVGDTVIIGIIAGIAGALFLFFLLISCMFVLWRRNLAIQRMEQYPRRMRMDRNSYIYPRNGPNHQVRGNPRTPVHREKERDSRLPLEDYLNREFSLPYFPPYSSDWPIERTQRNPGMVVY